MNRFPPLRLAFGLSLLAHLLVLVLVLLLSLRASDPPVAPMQVELLDQAGAGPVSHVAMAAHPASRQATSPRAPATAGTAAPSANTPDAMALAPAGAETHAVRAPAAESGTATGTPSGAGEPAGGSGVTASVVPARYLGDAQHPPYPEQARARGVEGRVEVLLTIAADGQVTGLVLTRSSGDDELDQAGMDLLRRGPYTPAQRAGVAIASKLRMAVPFRINH